MLKTIIILQARTGSSRLPNKVLEPIQDIPLLRHCIKRLKSIDNNVPVIVATSVLNRDDVIVELANNEEIDCYRGSETDVLDRYYKAAKQRNASYIMRATADNMFVDVFEARSLLDEIISGRWDYVSMIEKVNDRKLPIGVGLEAFNFYSLHESWKKGLEPNHREHVNEYILENHEYFKIAFMDCQPENSCPELRLTIDTLEDLEFIKTMLYKFNCAAFTLTTQDIIKWWKEEGIDLYSFRCRA